MRGLSRDQVDVLLSLRRNWPWGADSRTLRGLEQRGLVEVRPTLMRSGDVFDLPHLTAHGFTTATLLDVEARAAAGARRHWSGLQIIDGGRS